MLRAASHPSTMIRPSTQLLSVSALLLPAIGACLPAQQLRRAVAAAELVATGKVLRVQPTKTHVIHWFVVDEVLRAPKGIDKGSRVAILQTKGVAEHHQPQAARAMLCCLRDVSWRSTRGNLPQGLEQAFAPSGFAGGMVLLAQKGAEPDPRLGLARILVAAEQGGAPRQTLEKIYPLALQGDPRIRLEAAHLLAERQVLNGLLTPIHLSGLVGRAQGETEDIPYKIALAEICASRKLAALIPALAVSCEQVGDPRFLRALGRIARHIHGDQAAAALLPHLRRGRGRTKERLLLALGATNTEAALEHLLKLRRQPAWKKAADAALKVHASPRAAAALKSDQKQPR